MLANPQISFREGSLRLPVFVDRDESDDTEWLNLNTDDILFVGFDSQFRTVIHVMTRSGLTIEHPVASVREIADLLAGKRKVAEAREVGDGM